MRNSNYYLLNPSIVGVNEENKRKFASILEESGFTFKEGQMGAGPADIYHQVIAFLSIHSVFGTLLEAIAANYIVKLLDKLYGWYRKSYPSNSKYQPSVNINLYSGLQKKKSIFIWFYINKKYTKEEIVNKIKEAKKLRKT